MLLPCRRGILSVTSIPFSIRFATTSANAGKSKVNAKSETSIKREADKMPTPQPLLCRAEYKKTTMPTLSLEMKKDGNRIYSSTDTIRELLDTIRLPKRLKELFDLTKDKSFLWRKVTFELFEQIQTLDNIRILVDGARGSGKTCLLIQLLDRLLLASRQEEEFYFYFPRISTWTAGYYAYHPLSDGTFIQPDLANEIVSMTKKLNPKLESIQLDAAPIKQLQGIISKAKESRKITIIADEVNALYASTGYRDCKSQPLTVGQLAIPNMIRNLLETSPLTSTRLIAAFCRTNPALIDSTLDASKINTTLFNLPSLNVKEVEELLQYFRNVGLLGGDAMLRSKQYGRIHFVTGGSGASLLSATAYASVYKPRT